MCKISAPRFYDLQQATCTWRHWSSFVAACRLPDHSTVEGYVLIVVDWQIAKLENFISSCGFMQIVQVSARRCCNFCNDHREKQQSPSNSSNVSVLWQEHRIPCSYYTFHHILCGPWLILRRSCSHEDHQERSKPMCLKRISVCSTCMLWIHVPLSFLFGRRRAANRRL